MKPLSRQEKQFAQHFALYGEGKAAAIHAGYAPTHAKVTASRLRTRPEINAAIDRYSAKKMEQTQVTADSILAELAKVAFAKLAKVVRTQDKLKALELLAKHFKLFDDDSHDKDAEQFSGRWLDSFLASSPRWTPQQRELAKELAEVLQSPALKELRANPDLLFSKANLAPDRWQHELLEGNSHRLLLCCSRQAGKSQTAAAIALKAALLEPGSLILLLSPTLRQSGELFREKLLPLYAPWRDVCPPTAKTQLELILSNGSRIVSLPESEGNIRGYSGVKLIVIDEAARVSEGLYLSVRPMLAVSQGKLLALSSPFGKRGWFHDCWHGSETWHRVRVSAADCPRISKDFLEEERRELGDRWYRQEYECSFEETIDAVFRAEDIDAAFRDDYEPVILTP